MGAGPATVALAAALLAAPAARADGWAETFAPARAAALLPPGRWAVMVVEEAELDDVVAAAAALRDGLRRSGRTLAVLDGEALGSARALEDGALARRAADLPVDLLAVVRRTVYGGPPVRLAIFSRYGRLVGRWGARPGGVAVELPPRDDDDPLLPRPGSTGLGAPAGAHAERAFVDGLVLFRNPRRDVRVPATQPVLGLFEGRALSGPELYQALERPDLAARYRRRTGLIVGLALGGVAAGAGALAASILANSAHPTNLALGTAGAVLGGGALVAVGFSFVLDFDPVRSDEVMRLAEDHNRRLRRAAGFPAPDAPGPTP